MVDDRTLIVAGYLEDPCILRRNGEFWELASLREEGDAIGPY